MKDNYIEIRINADNIEINEGQAVLQYALSPDGSQPNPIEVAQELSHKLLLQLDDDRNKISMKSRVIIHDDFYDVVYRTLCMQIVENNIVKG